MALSILNNISSMTAENALSNTQANLQKTLTQLSTGMKINSGSDDAAGLSIAQGLTANIAALTQSQQNASNGIGMLQTADGALSQVTTLLNRAVTLATEGSTTGITASQSTALNTEFASIKSEIDQIGKTTNFNGQNVFSSNSASSYTSTASNLAAAGTDDLTANSVTSITDASTGGTFVFTANAGGTSTIANLTTAVQNAVTAGTLSAGTTAAVDAGGQLLITNSNGHSLTVSTNDAKLGAMSAAASTTSTGATTGIAAATDLGGVITIKDSGTGQTDAIDATNMDTAQFNSAIQTDIAAGKLSSGTTASLTSTGQVQISNSNGVGLTVTADAATLAVTGALSTSYSNNINDTSTVYIGDGTTTGPANTQITTTINSLSSSALSIASTNLSSASNATSALTAITNAINSVSAQRGVIGASVNRLTAASSNMSSEVTNLQSAANGIQNADIGKTVANMTQYNVLQSTGMAALQQSNQAQQAVLKLVQ
jgi:flagellin